MDLYCCQNLSASFLKIALYICSDMSVFLRVYWSHVLCCAGAGVGGFVGTQCLGLQILTCLLFIKIKKLKTILVYIYSWISHYTGPANKERRWIKLVVGKTIIWFDLNS